MITRLGMFMQFSIFANKFEESGIVQNVIFNGSSFCTFEIDKNSTNFCGILTIF